MESSCSTFVVSSERLRDNRSVVTLDCSFVCSVFQWHLYNGISECQCVEVVHRSPGWLFSGTLSLPWLLHFSFPSVHTNLYC